MKKKQPLTLSGWFVRVDWGKRSKKSDVTCLWEGIETRKRRNRRRSDKVRMEIEIRWEYNKMGIEEK